MGYLDGFLVTLRQHRAMGGERLTQPYSGGRVVGRRDAADEAKGLASARLRR